MRTVREIARLLGWPEGRRAPDRARHPLPAPPRPKVIVWRIRRGRRVWTVGHRVSVGVIEQDGPHGIAPSQAAALALGLAALGHMAAAVGVAHRAEFTAR